jgi:hypothetical protein
LDRCPKFPKLSSEPGVGSALVIDLYGIVIMIPAKREEFFVYHRDFGLIYPDTAPCAASCNSLPDAA